MENGNSGKPLTFKWYIKGASKVLLDYFVALMLFAVLFYVFALITKDAMNVWLPWYCLLMFLLMVPITYKDMKTQSIKDKRPAYGIALNPMRGLYVGLIAVIPLLLVFGISRLVVFDQALSNRLLHLGVNVVYGPIYWIVRIGRESIGSYLLAPLSVALVSMIGYLAGFYGFELRTRLFGPPKQHQPVKKPQGGRYSGR